MVAGWHPGEASIQELLNLAPHVQTAHSLIRDYIPDQHRLFHTSNIAFVPLTTLDASGRPWVSLVASKAGTTGFVSSPSETELVVNADVWDGDPIKSNLQPGGEALISGLGIEWATRRRNKFAGLIKNAALEGERLTLELGVNQTLGNCPKYINIRSVAPAVTSPRLIYERPTLAEGERLPDEVIEFVRKTDAVFLGTTYVAEASQQELFPSHLGTNHRGGRPGFVRVRNDGLTLVLPDYSGNRFMNSLGNVQATPLAALTILDFETGDVLYLTGRARNVFGKEAQSIMPRINLVTSIEVTGYTFVRDAMPVRQLPGSSITPSPYNPPVRYLAEEKPSSSSAGDISLTLERIQVHSLDLTTFHFTPSTPLSVRPGQAAIIDMSSFVGTRGYQHMAPGQETTLNDDGIRTWTVSGQSETGALMITVREKPGGYVTSRLFKMVRKMEQMMPGLLEDARPVGLTVPLVGIDGDFVLPKILDDQTAAKRLLWVAGGVGITPFLSMLRGALREGGNWDIVLLLATRQGDVGVFGQLVADALRPASNVEAVPLFLSLRVIVYSKGSNRDQAVDFGRLQDGSQVPVDVRSDRLTRGDLASIEADAVGRDVYVCGPLAMEELAIQGLKEAGIDPKEVHRENFAY